MEPAHRPINSAPGAGIGEPIHAEKIRQGYGKVTARVARNTRCGSQGFHKGRSDAKLTQRVADARVPGEGIVRLSRGVVWLATCTSSCITGMNVVQSSPSSKPAPL